MLNFILLTYKGLRGLVYTYFHTQNIKRLSCRPSNCIYVIHVHVIHEPVVPQILNLKVACQFELELIICLYFAQTVYHSHFLK